MMIKCQKCGFENQMGSIFCRECGEKLNMDAIDPNKLQKDVDKEKLIKRTKKRIKGAISGAITLIVIAAFVFLVFPDLFPFGHMRSYEEPTASEASAQQKFKAATGGTAVGRVKYSYPEVNQMLRKQVVEPLLEFDSFAKVTAMEVTYDETKNQPIVYLWISLKDKVPVLYTIYGGISYNAPEEGSKEPLTQPLKLDVKRLDIGRLPVYVSKNTFLNGLSSLLENEAVAGFFQRAKEVEFNAEGMTVNFAKGGPSSNMAPEASASSKSSKSSVKSSANSEKAEAARLKAEEEKEKKRQLEEERKRKAEEEAQRRKEKEEERKRKIEEENERRKQEAEERKRRQEEENERRRQEAEDRRREREERRNNNYNGSSRSSRNNRSSRNSNRW